MWQAGGRRQLVAAVIATTVGRGLHSLCRGFACGAAAQKYGAKAKGSLLHALTACTGGVAGNNGLYHLLTLWGIWLGGVMQPAKQL